MANLSSLTVEGILTRKKGTGTRPAGTTSGDLIQISGNDDLQSSGTNPIVTVTTCYHRAKNRVFAAFCDKGATGASGRTSESWAIAAAPTADGEDLDWGVYGGGSAIGWLQPHNISGNACSYDREKEKILWAAPQYDDGPHSDNLIYSRVIDLDSTWNTNTRSITYGAAVTWAIPSVVSCCIGPQALIYVGDDAGASAGKHVLLYAHSANNLRAVVGTIGSGSTVDWNTPLTNYAVFGTTTGGGTNYEAGGCKVADNKIAVYWTDGSSEAWCRVGTVASGLITFGTKVRLDLSSVSSSMAPSATSNCYDIASGKVVFAWWESSEGSGYRLMSRIGTVSGTGITLGTAVSITGWTNYHDGKVSVVYDENAQRTVIYYKRTDSVVKLYSRLCTITGTNIAFGTEKLVEAPAGSKTFERGPNTAWSYGCCSTYISHADTKKTIVIRPGGNASNSAGGYAKATMTHLNKTTLTVDLSQGNAFELDINTHTGLDGVIGTFTITESLGSGKTQMFFLKIIQGAPERNFDWSTISNIKWPGGTGPSLTQVFGNVDVLSFITWDEGTTWFGHIEGLDIR